MFLFKRETEEPVVENEKNIGSEKQSGEEDAADINKESPVDEPEEKEPEDKVRGHIRTLLCVYFLKFYICSHITRMFGIISIIVVIFLMYKYCSPDYRFRETLDNMFTEAE